MKVIKEKNAERSQNADNCKTIEYSFGDKDIDLGLATITGRYPESGYCVNLISKELVYVLEGSGSLILKNLEINFSEGDAILIEPNEKYYWDNCNCKVSMSCTPSWTHEQHKLVD